MHKIFTIKAALFNESLEAWVWTNDNSFENNNFIIIRNSVKNKSIKTFKRTIDANFVKYYNSQLNTSSINIINGKTYLILNEFYRKQLDVNTNDEVNLEIKHQSKYTIWNRFNWVHPNPTIQYANKANLLSLILGLIALLMTIYSLYVTIYPKT